MRDDSDTVDLRGGKPAVLGVSPALDERAARRKQPAQPGAAKLAGESLLAAASTAPRSASAGRCVGAKIGRFTILDRLGEGGMGEVVAAHDPKVDRKVAIKLLHPEARMDASSEESALCLVREAQAMAKLSHPNVVAVHEVGTVGDEVFIAMEYVEGVTLDRWCEQARSWREVVELMSRAGEGLVAAHAAGLVHRDFKPQNVLVGNDGRVLVSDFGIVGTSGSMSAQDLLDSLELLPGSVLENVTLRRDGVLLGTLTYIAPEHFEQKPVDARADQFAFCVTLYESLYGQRPFEGERYPDLLRAVCDGVVRPPPGDTSVPAWINCVVVRGLSTDPAERYPSMRALLDALARDPNNARRRRMTAVAVGAALVAAASAAAYALILSPGRADSRCKGAEAELSSVWNESSKSAIATSLLATDRPYARQAYDRVVELFDQHAKAWVEMRTNTCEATHIRGEQSEEVLDLRMRCLDRRLSAARELLRVIGEASDDASLGSAVDAASKLPSIAGCGDIDALRSQTQPPNDPAVRARVEALRSRLDRVDALFDAGQYPQGLALVEIVLEEARELDHAPTLALALHRRGQLQLNSDRLDASEDSLRAAIRVGALGKADRLVVDVWQDLMWLVGYERARHDDALALRETVETAIARAGDPPESRARYLRTVGVIQHAKGEYRQARETLERALAIVDEVGTIKEPDAAQILHSLGTTTGMLGDLAAARRYQERAKDIFERHFGAKHPNVTLALESLADLARREGKHEVSLSLRQEVLDIRESFFGPEHREVAQALNNLGTQLAVLERYDEARAAYDRALTIWKKQLRPGHPDLANALVNLGEVAAAAGDFEGAQSYFERALARLEKALGPDHVRTGTAKFNLGNVLLDQGKCRQALVPMQDALVIFENSLGKKHPFVGYPLGGIGSCHIELGEPAKAVAPLERAVVLLGAGPGTAEVHAATQFSLARALWHRKRDRGRALALAKQARAAQTGFGERGSKEVVKIDRWLRAH